MYMRAFLLIATVAGLSCSPTEESPVPFIRYHDPIAETEGIPLNKLNLPEGFHVMLYAWDVPNARSMAQSPDGWIFVGSRSAGNVYALKDTDGDHRVDIKLTLARNLNMPNGVAYRNGDLYIAEVSEISVIRDVTNGIGENMTRETIYDNLPSNLSHGWKYITFGPDDKLYIPIGAPCNVCEEPDPFASICRINPDGTSFEIVQRGIRNTVGITFHPGTGDIWFTDNGRDWLGDDQPFCELNRAAEDNLHFGFPYCHQGDLPYPDYGTDKDCADYTPPAINLGPHVAPLGLEFYRGSDFPPAYDLDILIAEHGSWNRTVPIGYRITKVEVDEQSNATSYDTFIDGWLDNGSPWGRPVDIEILPDGSILISDDYADAIYRVWYDR